MPVKHPLYQTWYQMHRRCYRVENHNYHRYGGRGITVHPDWHVPDGFRLFCADMGSKSAGLTLDRIDNDGPYSKENCRWATIKEQNDNRGDRLLVRFAGRDVLLADLADAASIDRTAIRARLSRGLSVSESLFSGRIPVPAGSESRVRAGLKRRRVRLTIEGQPYWLVDLAKISGLKPDTIVDRAKSGLPYDAVMDPARRLPANAKLTPETAASIRADKSSSNTDLAKQYGVSRHTIGLVRAGKRFA